LCFTFEKNVLYLFKKNTQGHLMSYIPVSAFSGPVYNANPSLNEPEMVFARSLAHMLVCCPPDPGKLLLSRYDTDGTEGLSFNEYTAMVEAELPKARSPQK
jgi:hypothetical protein